MSSAKIIFLCVLFGLPLGSLFYLPEFSSQGEALTHLWQVNLPTALVNTTLIISVVLFLSSVFAISSTVFLFHFQGLSRKLLLSLALVPLAWPSLNISYLQRSFFSFTSPLYTGLRDFGFNLPDMNAHLGLSLSLACVLSPYLVMALYLNMARNESRLLETQKLFQFGPWSLLRKFALPLARPTLFFSGLLVTFEVLSDLGAGLSWNVDTLSVLVIKTWFSLYSVTAAKTVAAAIFVLCILFLYLKSKVRAFQEVQTLKPEGPQNTPLFGLRNTGLFWGSGFIFLTSILLSLFVPLFELTRVFLASSIEFSNWISPAITTICLTSILSASLVFFVLWAYRSIRTAKSSVRFLFFSGYALPGTLFVLAFLPISSWAKTSSLLDFLSPTFLFFLLLLWAYAVKYSSVGLSFFEQAEMSLNQSQRDLLFSQTAFYKKSEAKLYFSWGLSHFFPIFCLYFLDLVKELPLVLLMRPFGWNNLTTRTYDLVSEGFWAEAAPLTAALFLICLVALYFGLLLPRFFARGSS